MNRTMGLGRLDEIRARMEVERLARKAFVQRLKQTVAEMRRAFALENQAVRDAWLGRKLSTVKVARIPKVVSTLEVAVSAKSKIPLPERVVAQVVAVVETPERIVAPEVVPEVVSSRIVIEPNVVSIAEFVTEPEIVRMADVAQSPEAMPEPEVTPSSEIVQVSDVAPSSELSGAKPPMAARPKRHARKHRPL
ncbi:MAG: hypothetical protein WAO71_03460 [Gallionella sp.]